MENEKNSLKVCKFGGTSLATKKSFELVANIIFADKNRKYIVASAQGKRFVADKKVTDLLILLYELYRNGENFQEIFENIKYRHLCIRDSLKINLDIEKEFEVIYKNMNLGREYLLSRGEYLNAKLLAKYLNFNFFDAKDLFVFSNGKINLEKTKQNLIGLPCYSVVSGFYGKDEKSGKITLFPRGGGDISGAILALAKNALYENFTDTSGIFSGDPKVIKNAERLNELSYDNLKTMSQLGANVVHKSVSSVLSGKWITLKVLNTFAPNVGGTLVYDSIESTKNIRPAVVIKNNTVSVVYFNNIDLSTEIYRLLNAFKSINVETKKIKADFKKKYITFEVEKGIVAKVANILYNFSNSTTVHC